jgi:dipeptidyl aminopeptidase/acylaminoacyl peptidase
MTGGAGSCRAGVIALVALLHASTLLGVGVGVAGESAEMIFPGDGVTSVSLSPSGDWLAATLRRGDKSIVAVQRVGNPAQKRLVESSRPLSIVWDGPDSLIIVGAAPSGIRQILVSRFSFENGEIDADQRHIATQYGELVDALPLVPEQVVWAFRHRSATSLHRVSIDQLVEYGKLRTHALLSIDLGEKLVVEWGQLSNWVVDRDGTPRAALRKVEGATVVLMAPRKGDKLRVVHRFAVDELERLVVPVGLTQDGKDVIVQAYAGGDTLGLYRWDQAARKVGKPVFVHPSYDVVQVRSDPLTGELVAAVYEEDGEPRYEYFEAYRVDFLEKLPEAWRRPTISVVNGASDRETFVLFDASATNPGDYFVRERDGAITRVGRLGDNVDREKRAPVEAFRVKSKDGLEIEAFLALPLDASSPVPLVVMPHGGPHRVRDSRRFDPVVQYLASWGFAVLQVNYRGSAGYGLNFEVLVKKQWARGIEDDIDAAVESATKLPAVDGTRICIVGRSYGGFSALAGTIRHRDRYRCAVTINGVADVPLLYDTSDMADSKWTMQFYEEYVGDIRTERDRLLEVSPAYHLEQVSVPILVVYGTADRRVDPDHAHRMLLMLELYGKPHESLEIDEGEHGFDRYGSIAVWRTVRRFLSRHLEPELPFEPDPPLPF